MSLNERAIFISQQLSQCNPASLKPDDVKEISSLLQQFATSQSSSNSSSSLSVSAPRSPDVKIRHPEYFHGQRKQLGEFLSQVMMVIETQPANFASVIKLKFYISVFISVAPLILGLNHILKLFELQVNTHVSLISMILLKFFELLLVILILAQLLVAIYFGFTKVTHLRLIMLLLSNVLLFVPSGILKL
jgi:hypothetical protein